MTKKVKIKLSQNWHSSHGSRNPSFKGATVRPYVLAGIVALDWVSVLCSNFICSADMHGGLECGGYMLSVRDSEEKKAAPTLT